MSTRKVASKAKSSTGHVVVRPDAAEAVETAFAEVVGLIEQARQRAYQAVDKELVELAAAVWGEGVVDRLAQHLARTMPGQRGFTRRNLFRMRQFYETYSADKKVTALLTQLPWTHNLIILTQSKRPEEREFYLRMAVQENWKSRELERQYSLGAFERAVLSPTKVSAALTQMHGDAAAGVFKDAYSVEFLKLPTDHTEADLHRGLLGQLRAFLIELGRDFCFVGSEFPGADGWSRGRMTRNRFQRMSVELEQLLLDKHNARIRFGANQEDCIKRILKKERQVLKLIEDIAKNGLSTAPILVSPGEAADTWIVRDGNRRVASMKLLSKPELSGNPDVILPERTIVLEKP